MRAMAKTRTTTVLALLLLLLSVHDLAEGGSSKVGEMVMQQQQHRKLKTVEKMKMKMKMGMGMEDWEMRRVPGGPDPLHHNGQDPTTPRTIP